MEIIVTEDSNSGFQFFSHLFTNSAVKSANGNSKILDLIQKLTAGDILAITDGAAFGAMIEKFLEYSATRLNQRISVWMPESFEYLIVTIQNP